MVLAPGPSGVKGEAQSVEGCNAKVSINEEFDVWGAVQQEGMTGAIK